MSRRVPVQDSEQLNEPMIYVGVRRQLPMQSQSPRTPIVASRAARRLLATLLRCAPCTRIAPLSWPSRWESRGKPSVKTVCRIGVRGDPPPWRCSRALLVWKSANVWAKMASCHAGRLAGVMVLMRDANPLRGRVTNGDGEAHGAMRREHGLPSMRSDRRRTRPASRERIAMRLRDFFCRPSRPSVA